MNFQESLFGSIPWSLRCNQKCDEVTSVFAVIVLEGDQRHIY